MHTHPSEVQISTDCWKAARDADTVAKDQWLAARRAEEQAAAIEWAERFDMPPLEGSERALAWGERSRFQLVTAAYTALVSEGTWDEADWAVLEDKIRSISRAGWWIDQVRHEAPHNRVEVEGLHRRPVAAWVAKLRAA
ncbi:hypothetical protein ACFXGT_33215 [Streptomyces sp. NPDC059352]|uniref:hypothetical protein n=1 Tax=Streptomyces sp. NPDC059352 TaxID=3346810 RepID=UPI00368AB107